MPELIIESNGRLEKTAVYLNGEQLTGIKELFVSLDETGVFDALLSYKGGDGQEYTKSIFTDYLTAVQVTEPSFTYEDAMALQKITVDSDGDIEDTLIAWNDEELDGLISVYVHIKARAEENSSIFDKLMNKKKTPVGVQCKAELVFREEDDSEHLETVF
jgi:hypothetical protein